MNHGEMLCSVCHFGRLRPRRVTYVQMFEGRPVVIPNVPALVCDVCGERVLDDQVLARLSGLLSQDGRHPPSPPRRPPL